jgi:hypothetical protein
MISDHSQMREGMGFLDNLENSLKSLESQGERDSAEAERRARDKAQAIAPWAEKLKQAPYTRVLMEEATKAGHKLRTKVYMSWMDGMFCLQARDRKLNLQPTGTGVVAYFIERDGSERQEAVDLNGDAA